MSQMWAIARKDLNAYFISPAAYIVAAVYLVLCGFFFWTLIRTFAVMDAYSVGYQSEIRYLIQNMALVFLFVSPMLTMRTFSEEKKLGTMELLITSPISISSVILGKFLAVALFFFILTAMTWQYPIFLAGFGELDIRLMLTAYGGFILMGLAFISIGIFMSSLTENQIVATVLTFGVLLLLYVIGWAGDQLSGVAGSICKGLSMTAHLENFSKGVIDLRDITYYVSVCTGFLFITMRRFEWNRW